MTGILSALIVSVAFLLFVVLTAWVWWAGRPRPLTLVVDDPTPDPEQEVRDGLEALMEGRCRSARREVEQLILAIRNGAEMGQVVDGLLEVHRELTKVGAR